MCAGFERDVHRRPARSFARELERHRLGVRLAISRMPAHGHDATLPHDDGADHWVRRRLSPAATRGFERERHVRGIAAVFHIPRFTAQT